MVNFREAQNNDFEQIALLHADSWRTTYRGMMPDHFLDGDVVSNRIQVWRERLMQYRADQFVLLAEENGTLIGFICIYSNEDPTWGSYIDNLHVAQDYKRRKVGNSLMTHAANWLEQRYPKIGVYLWVMEANIAARRFYERLGASNAGTLEKRDPAGGSAPNCRYVWSRPKELTDTTHRPFNSLN